MAQVQIARSDRLFTPSGVRAAPVGRGRRALAIVFAAVLASRLPFVALAPGPGRDLDATRLVLAGRALAATGRYHLSRNPGYPLVELVSAGLASMPVWVLVAATAVVGAVGAAAFADLLRALGVRAWVPLVVAYAATPVVWLSDLTFMDYSWAQAAVVTSLALLARRRFLGCGVLLGLAIACRPGALVVAVVVLVVLVGGRHPRAAWWRVSAFVPVVGLFQLPPLVTLGPLYVRFVDQHVPFSAAAGRLTTGVWGWAGVVAVGVGLVLAATTARRWWPALAPDHRTWAGACVVGTAVTTGLFLRLPVDSGYLLPCVPLVLLLVGLLLPARSLVAVAGALLLGALFAPGPKAMGVSIPEAAAERQAQQAALVPVAAAARELAPGETLVVGKDLPRVLVLLPEAESRGLEFDLGWNPIPECAVLPRGGRICAR